MSNLSDLLPAGAGAKSATFTADGTLASGQTVALQSDGTVTAVGESAASVGTQTTFEAASLNVLDSTYDTANGKVILVYSDVTNSFYGTAVVGTVSGASISFGTPVVFASAMTQYTRVTYDSNAGKVVVSYSDYGNSDYGTAIVGTVSGTTISFGSEVVYNSGATYDQDIAYDSTNNKVVIVYRDSAASNYGNGIVGTVSGTSISFGSEATFNSGNTSVPKLAYDPVNEKMVVIYGDTSAGGNGTAAVGTVSGTSISWGSEVTFTSSGINGSYNTIVYDSTAQKMIIGYRDNTNLYGTAKVGTVSGTSMTFGSEQTYTSTSAVTVQRGMVYDPTVNKTIVAYADSNANESYVQELTVSGTTITGSTPLRFNTGSGTTALYTTLALDSANNKTVISFRDSGNTDYGVSVVYSPLSTNSADFIGITDQAIADTATGSVVVEGGVTEKVSGLTTGSTYYVQDDGSLSTTSSSVTAGKALSATKLLLKG